MTGRPILFSAAMIRAILREIEAPGTGKTQTRRVMNPQPKGISSANRVHSSCWDITPESNCCSVDFQAPKFAAGDRLWVRETWAARMIHGWTIADARSRMCQEEILYKADEHNSIDGWWPSIHMPREFSRLTLHVTDVRVQRLQDISEADARAEGIERLKSGRGYYDHTVSKGAVRAGIWHHKATDAFEVLWDGLNAKRAPWASNPWVVAVTFRPELGNIDRVAA